MPDAVPYKGLTYSDGTSYVTIEAFWDGNVGSVSLHETIHTRQSSTLDREMTWFQEASAESLSYRVMQEQYGPVTDSESEHDSMQFRITTKPNWRLHPRGMETPLTTPRVSDSSMLSTRRSERVAAANTRYSMFFTR